MSIAIPVTGDAAAEGDFVTIDVETSPMAVYHHYGAYEKMMVGHMAMEEYFTKNNLEYKYPVMEQYVTDPGQEADTSKWLTNIVYLHD